MKNIKKEAIVALLALGSVTGIYANGLPVKEILGQQYYVYEVKKGDSVYGVTHRFGWDEAEFVRLNPSAADGLKRGEVVYYPTGKVTAVEIESHSAPVLVPDELPALTHEVKRGETVYSIAKMYDIPVSVIYDSYPSSKSGIKAGEILTIDQNKAGFGKSDKLPFFYITIKTGDTLYSTAKKYGTSVEDLMGANPGVSEFSFKAGSILKVPVSHRGPKVRRTLVEEQTVGSLATYKVDKDDNWNSISRKTGVSVEELQEANNDVKRLRKNDVLAVPSVETVTVEKDVPYTDPREENVEGRKEIYDSIHHIGDNTIRNVRIALMMDDPEARRDIEFSRGFLMAVKQLGNPGYKVNIKVLAANLPIEDVLKSIDEFNPQVVFTLSDKGAADWLVNYGSSKGIEAVNVFDAKSDTYTSTPSVIQLLSPSAYFNDAVAREVAERYSDRKLLTVTKGVDADQLADAIAAAFSAGESRRVQIDNLNSTLLPSGDELVVVADLTDKADIEKLFSQLSAAKESNPLLNIAVVGRPNWVTFAESMAEQFYNNDVTIPSRFFFNPESEAGKSFIADYTALYERGPLKSYPNYAATGYDAANWFIPALAINEGDFNVTVPKADMLQMPVELNRISNWGGFYNGASMLIHYTPWRMIETDIVK